MKRTRVPRLLIGSTGAAYAVVTMMVGAGLTGMAQRDARTQPARTPPRTHTSAEAMPWTTTNRYPEWFRRTYRYKELVGGVSAWQSMAGEWKGIPHAEIRMGTLQLDRGAIYPFHAHPAPELYYVIKGQAEWTVGDETFTATPGTAIHAPPDTRHQMINTGTETLELLFIWWAPGGDQQVLDVASRMLDGWDRPGARTR